MHEHYLNYQTNTNQTGLEIQLVQFYCHTVDQLVKKAQPSRGDKKTNLVEL